jgi:hypothetical protein
MTIPPIGSQVGPLIPQDESANGKVVKQASSTPDNAPQVGQTAKTDAVEISPEAEKVREHQAQATRLHTLQRAATGIEKDSQAIRDKLDQAHRARQAGDQKALDNAHKEIEDKLKSIEAHRDKATFNGQNVLTDPQASRTLAVQRGASEVQRCLSDTRDAVQNNQRPPDNQLPEAMAAVADEAEKARAAIEQEVKNTVAGAVRESSKSMPNDVKDAERLIQQARDSNPTAHGASANAEQLARKAVNLLQ